MGGVSALTGLGLAVEIGDWTRFTGASIGAYVGLVPTEYSSGSSRVQGSIKAGNAHVRRLLVESAWHHRAAYRNPVRRCGPGGPWSIPRSRPAGMPVTADCINSGAGSTSVRSLTWWLTSRSPASWPAGAGRWQP